VTKTGISGTCGTYGGEEKCMQVLVEKTGQKSEDERVVGRVALELILSERERESVPKLYSLRIGTGGITL
jgi:hypothetical protein